VITGSLQTGTTGAEQTVTPAVGEAKALRAYVQEHNGAKMRYGDGSFSVLKPTGEYYFRESDAEPIRDSDRGSYWFQGNQRCVQFTEPSYKRCDTLLPGRILRNRYDKKIPYTLSTIAT